MYGISWWISFLATQDVTGLKYWNMKNLKHEKSGKPISIQVLWVDLQFFGKVNVAAVTDSGYKLLLEKHNNPVEKTEILCKIINCLKFLENLNFIWRNMIKVPAQRKWLQPRSAAMTRFE